MNTVRVLPTLTPDQLMRLAAQYLLVIVGERLYLNPKIETGD